MTSARYSQAPLLWAALVRARAENAPLTRGHLQDAVFRMYLPLARSRARNVVQQVDAGHEAVTAAAADQAAEMGLAQAVLSWRYSDSQRFELFALDMIDSRLRLASGEATAGNRMILHLPAEIPAAGLVASVPPVSRGRNFGG